MNIAALLTQTGSQPLTNAPCGTSSANLFQGILGTGPPKVLQQNTQGWVTQFFLANPEFAPIYALQQCVTAGTLYMGGFPAGVVPLYTPSPVYNRNNFYSGFYTVVLSACSLLFGFRFGFRTYSIFYREPSQRDDQRRDSAGAGHDHDRG